MQLFSFSVSLMNNLVSLPSHELHRYLGSRLVSESKVEFCVWSPTVDCVHIYLEGRDGEQPLALNQQDGGYHVGEMDQFVRETVISVLLTAGQKDQIPLHVFSLMGFTAQARLFPAILRGLILCGRECPVNRW
jgi:hypothetical protein